MKALLLVLVVLFTNGCMAHVTEVNTPDGQRAVVIESRSMAGFLQSATEQCPGGWIEPGPSEGHLYFYANAYFANLHTTKEHLIVCKAGTAPVGESELMMGNTDPRRFDKLKDVLVR
jgi:hypothetical protein